MYVVKDYDERRNEFLDTAMRLFLERGYEQTSVNAIIESVGVSKGAFYHYFRTKEEVLDQLADRATVQAAALLEPVVTDESLNAVAKLNELFHRTNAFKAQNLELMRTLLRVYFSDQNVLLRRRLLAQNVEVVGPLIARILEQGNREGTMAVDFPEEAAAFVLRIGAELVEQIARLFSEIDRDPSAVDRILRHLEMYNQSVERILGVEPGGLSLVDESVVTVIKGVSDD